MKIGAIPENVVEFVLSVFGAVPTPLLDTFQAVARARAIMVAARLEIFEALDDAPLTAAEVAERLNIDPRATEKLLNTLVGARYLRFAFPRYRLTRTSRKWLLSGSSRSLHDNMVYRFLEWEAIEAFEDFVRTGRHLNVHENLSAEQWESYQRGMRSLAGLSAHEVARRLPVPGAARTMLDVGGSHGYYSVALCRRYPQLRSTVLDLPAAVQFARPILERERMGDRVVHRAEDARHADLGANEWDLVFISQFVHHLDASANAMLMERVARSLRPGGIVAIVEILRAESPNSGETAAVLDLFFAVTSLSGCWSSAELAGWQRGAGLIPRKPIHLLSIPGAAIQTAVKPGEPR